MDAQACHHSNLIHILSVAGARNAAFGPPKAGHGVTLELAVMPMSGCIGGASSQLANTDWADDARAELVRHWVYIRVGGRTWSTHS